MSKRQIKSGCFVLQWLNSFGTTFYFYYLFFFMAKEFGFGNFGNLCISALNGFVYIFGSLYGGRFGQRHGYFSALGLGFGIMVVALLFAAFAHSPAAQISWMVVWTLGVCFTWPALEALVSEGESPIGVQRMVGLYNLGWASAGAVAYFTGGLIIEKLGLRSIFWLPIGLHVVQIILLVRLRARAAAVAGTDAAVPLAVPAHFELNPRPIARTRAFLRMAWAANPFAYVAINTLAAVIPGLARDLGLTPMFAGFFCSIWLFTRLLAFLGLWLWPGWHYRLGWFFGAFALLVVSFALILLVPRLWVVILAQAGFGIAIGLIYYSSLFYSMDVSETKGEHGGVHEAAIGLGIFMGPALGAATLRLVPGIPSSGAWAVTALLCLGFAITIGVWRKSRW